MMMCCSLPFMMMMMMMMGKFVPENSNLFFLCAEKTSQRSQKAKNFLVLSSPVFRVRAFSSSNATATPRRVQTTQRSKRRKATDDDDDADGRKSLCRGKSKTLRGKRSKNDTNPKFFHFQKEEEGERKKKKTSKLFKTHTRKRKDTHLKHTLTHYCARRRR